MTTYRKSSAALACAAVLFTAGAARAQALEQAFAPLSVPGIELASLDVPVAAAKPALAPAPAMEPEPVAAPAPVPAPKPKGFWEKTLNFFGF